MYLKEGGWVGSLEEKYVDREEKALEPNPGPGSGMAGWEPKPAHPRSGMPSVTLSARLLYYVTYPVMHPLPQEMGRREDK